MLNFIKSMGMFGPLLIVLAIVIAVLSIRKIVDLFAGKDLSTARLEQGLHAILFWGIMSAMLGFIGQASGLYNALSAISRAKQISPNIVAGGFAESLTTTIFGLTVLLVSAVVWFVLFLRFKRMTASS